jgi:hypothetical protein
MKELSIEQMEIVSGGLDCSPANTSGIIIGATVAGILTMGWGFAVVVAGVGAYLNYRCPNIG